MKKWFIWYCDGTDILKGSGCPGFVGQKGAFWKSKRWQVYYMLRDRKWLWWGVLSLPFLFLLLAKLQVSYGFGDVGLQIKWSFYRFFLALRCHHRPIYNFISDFTKQILFMVEVFFIWFAVFLLFSETLFFCMCYMDRYISTVLTWSLITSILWQIKFCNHVRCFIFVYFWI